MRGNPSSLLPANRKRTSMSGGGIKSLSEVSSPRAVDGDGRRRSYQELLDVRFENYLKLSLGIKVFNGIVVTSSNYFLYYNIT